MSVSDRLRVAIIGGGGTGVAVLYDLVRRGMDAVLLEAGELTSGTTGRHHGQLHCGARYAVGDPRIGADCYDESVILRRIAAPSIEYNSGLFVATCDEDLAYLPAFLAGCAAAGIPARELLPDEARRMEPALNPEIRAAVWVPDGTIDAYRLVMQFAATAARYGGEFRRFCEVDGIDVRAGHVTGIEYHDRVTGETGGISCDVVINATGVWGARTAALAGSLLEVTPSPGTMVAFKGRLNNMVVSRLHPPGDGDIVVPQRMLSIVGSTQRLSDRPDDPRVFDADVDMLRRAGAKLVSGIGDAGIYASWTASRPLVGNAGGTGTAGNVRSLSRDFACIDHGATEGVHGFYSVIGGKATVLRKMAEDMTDMICAAHSIDGLCTTADEPLDDFRRFFVPERRSR